MHKMRAKLRLSLLKRFDTDMQEVVSGAGIAFLLRVTGAGLGFSSNLLLAHLLGAEGVGIYYLAFTITSIAAIIGTIGLDNALLRFIAASAAQKDWGRIAGVYRKGVSFVISACIIVTLVIFTTASWIAESVFSDPELTEPLRLMALGILPMALITLHAEALKGLKRIRDATLIQGFGLSFTNVPLLALLGGTLGVIGAVAAYVASTLIVLSLGIVIWRRAMLQIRSETIINFDTRLLLTTSSPLLWLALVNLGMTMTDTIMLGIWADSESIGIYGAAARTAMLTSFILIAVNSIAAPKFAALYAQGNIQDLNHLALNSSRLTALLATPVLLVFLFAPERVLWLFGPEFKAGATVLSVLAVGQFVNAATGSVGYLLIMTGYEKIERSLAVGFFLINLLLNFILIPLLGIVGAAISTTLSLGSRNLVAYLIAKNRGLIGRSRQ